MTVNGQLLEVLLKVRDITLVVDVRKMPRSRHNPQFNRDTLPRALGDAGIGYLDVPCLGGLRRSRAESPDGGEALDRRAQ